MTLQNHRSQMPCSGLMVDSAIGKPTIHNAATKAVKLIRNATKSRAMHSLEIMNYYTSTCIDTDEMMMLNYTYQNCTI